MGRSRAFARAGEFERMRQLNEAILDCAGEGICGLDPGGVVTFANPAAARMVGRQVEELVGSRMHEAAHHSRADRSPYPFEDSPVRATLDDGAVRRVADEVFWRKDGTSFPVEYTVAPIQQGGEVAGAVVTFRDVTDRVRAEEDLGESEEIFRLLDDDTARNAPKWTDKKWGPGFLADRMRGRAKEGRFFEEPKPGYFRRLSAITTICARQCAGQRGL